MSKIFTLEELEKYKGEDDADRHEGKVIFAIRDTKEIKNATKYNVYDVTTYLEDHPGGNDIMKENSGIDASDKWWNIGHSEEAMVKMKEYIIGQLTDFDCAMLKATTTKLKIREDGYDNDMIKKKFDDYLFIKKNGDLVNLKKKDINNYDIKEIINFEADNYDFKKSKPLMRAKLEIWYRNEEKYNIIEKKSKYSGFSEKKKKLNINYYHLRNIITRLIRNKNLRKKHKIKLKYICDRTLFFFVFFYIYNYIKKINKFNLQIKNFKKIINIFIEIDYDFNYIMEGNNYESKLCNTYTVLDYLISDYDDPYLNVKLENLKYILEFLNIIKENNIKLDDKIYYHFFYKFYKNFEDFDIFALKNRWGIININNEIAQKEKFISDYKKIFKNIFNILSKKISLFKSYEQLGIDNKYCFREKYPIETLIKNSTIEFVLMDKLSKNKEFKQILSEEVNKFVELIFFKTLKNILKYFNTFVEYYWDYAYGLLLYDDKKRELEGYKWDDLKKTFNYVDVNHLNIKNKDKKEYSNETIISTINIIGPPPIEPEETDTTKYNKYKKSRYEYYLKKNKNKKVWTEEIHNYVVLENEDTDENKLNTEFNTEFNAAFQKIITNEKLFETYYIFANIDIYENKNFIEIMVQNIKQEKFIEIMKQNIKDFSDKYLNNNEEQTDYFINLLIKKIKNDYKNI